LPPPPRFSSLSLVIGEQEGFGCCSQKPLNHICISFAQEFSRQQQKIPREKNKNKTGLRFFLKWK